MQPVEETDLGAFDKIPAGYITESELIQALFPLKRDWSVSGIGEAGLYSQGMRARSWEDLVAPIILAGAISRMTVLHTDAPTRYMAWLQARWYAFR